MIALFFIHLWNSQKVSKATLNIFATIELENNRIILCTAITISIKNVLYTEVHNIAYMYMCIQILLLARHNLQLV